VAEVLKEVDYIGAETKLRNRGTVAKTKLL
jgi:hypothetical protein